MQSFALLPALSLFQYMRPQTTAAAQVVGRVTGFGLRKNYWSIQQILCRTATVKMAITHYIAVSYGENLFYPFYLVNVVVEIQHRSLMNCRKFLSCNELRGAGFWPVSAQELNRFYSRGGGGIPGISPN